MLRAAEGWDALALYWEWLELWPPKQAGGWFCLPWHLGEQVHKNKPSFDVLVLTYVFNLARKIACHCCLGKRRANINADSLGKEISGSHTLGSGGYPLVWSIPAASSGASGTLQMSPRPKPPTQSTGLSTASCLHLPIRAGSHDQQQCSCAYSICLLGCWNTYLLFLWDFVMIHGLLSINQQSISFPPSLKGCKGYSFSTGMWGCTLKTSREGHPCRSLA